MTFTGKIRAYLILAALVPPLLVMAVIYWQASEMSETQLRQYSSESLSRLEIFRKAYRAETLEVIREVGSTPTVREGVQLISSNRRNRWSREGFGSLRVGVDFLEIIDKDFRVQASSHRPGLVGEVLSVNEILPLAGEYASFETVEYDIGGAHSSQTYIVPLERGLYLYSGKYVSGEYVDMVGALIGAPVVMEFADSADAQLAEMMPGQLYYHNDSLMAVVEGGSESGFYLRAMFTAPSVEPLSRSLLEATGVVALASILVAIGLGMLVTSRAKREIDNLVTATSRVAEGDFSTPVMAYEEGEFSQLADSFSDMMERLKRIQVQLSTTEKIAAWEAMGRKIAHEIRNPLTPIAISVDDLRRSHLEKLPGFDGILKETTDTIKSEVSRLNHLLDEFVRFARMRAPEMDDVAPQSILDHVAGLYRAEVEAGRLAVTNNCRKRLIKADAELMQQLLINLVKNALESAEGVSVSVTVGDADGGCLFRVEDTGPGFPEDVLASSFQPYLSHKENGSGLGLVVCQRIVHDHGGTIEIYNRDEGGAGVLVTLPN